MKRDIYKKIMNLQTSQADALLVHKCNDLSSNIYAAKDNDTIFKQLEALEQFIFKVSDKAVVLMKWILQMKPLSAHTYETKYGRIGGKNYDDVTKKVLELLDSIRYYQTAEILPIYYQSFKRGTPGPLGDKLRNIAQYNLQALRYMGYRPQMDIVEFLDNLQPKDDKYVAFFMELLKHLVSVEGESHHMKDENTLVFGYGALPYTHELEDIRTWLLNEIERLLSLPTLSLDTKEKLIEKLRGFTDEPHRGEASKELKSLLERNTKRVIGIYGSYVSADKRAQAPLPLLLEIEKQTIFIKRGELPKQILTAANAIIASLRKSYSYGVYRILVGEQLDFFSRETTSVESAQAENENKCKELLAALNSKNDPLVVVLHEIAAYFDSVDAWKFNSYSGFLAAIATKKPLIAYAILQDAAQNNRPLVKRAGDFLIGFRRGESRNEFDKTLPIITKNKMTWAVRSVALALTIGDITDADIETATRILRRKDEYAFLGADDWISYDHFITEIFVKLLSRKKRIYDDLFIEVLGQFTHQPGSFVMHVIGRYLDASALSTRARSHLLVLLVKVSDLDYACQELLLKLVGADAEGLIEFFGRRIQRQLEIDEKYDKDIRYEAVPYHFNKTLISAFKEDKKYPLVTKKVIKTFSTKWASGDSEFAALFRRIGGTKKAMLQFIRTAKKDDLYKALIFCDPFGPADLDVVMAIAKKTTDKRIRESLRTRIYNTGMVSGEYGLANEHQRKHDYLKENYGHSPNKNIQSFLLGILPWLQETIVAERQRTDEELRLRKIDFEH